jgi:hypothetical protein
MQKKKWKDETYTLCCANGRVVFYQFEDPPDLIKSLIDNFHPLSKHFFDNSGRYTILLQMTSFGANEIAEGNFMPIFKMQGQVFHLIDSLLPKIGNNATFLQTYFVRVGSNSLFSSGFLPHKLKLKVGAPITLLRNIQPPILCNGTRL